MIEEKDLVEKYGDICVIATKKLNEIADSLLRNSRFTSVEQIEEFWAYYSDYNDKCVEEVKGLERDDIVKKEDVYR